MLGYNIAISIIAIMLSIGGIILGIGYALSNKKLKEFGYDEIFQSILNGIIVGILFISFAPNGLISNSINGIVQTSSVSATCQSYMSQNTAICFSYNYLIGSIPISINGNKYPSLLIDSRNLLIPVSIVYASVAVINSIEINLLIASINLNGMFNPILKETGLIIRAIITSIFGIYMQSILLNIISVIAIPILLPIGIVLRTFYPTRKLGGAIMAIAIGLFAVFPLTYLLDAHITSNFTNMVYSNQKTDSFTIGLNTIKNEVISVHSNTSSSSLPIIKAISSSAKNLFLSFYAWIKQTLDMFALLVIEVFVLPLFSLILTIISIRELATILGSEISLGKFDIF